MGQHLMQPASAIFLGWVSALSGRQYYVRQLRDAKIRPLVEAFGPEMLEVYAMACGWVLARAHSRSSEMSATIHGYLGSSNDEFDKAMGKFAMSYADQTECDHAALKRYVRPVQRHPLDAECRSLVATMRTSVRARPNPEMRKRAKQIVLRFKSWERQTRSSRTSRRIAS
jgi:hypothetical protein